MSLIKRISRIFKKKGQGNEEKVYIHNYVGKFVVQNGIGIGESIALEGNRIIVKNSDSYVSIPVEKIAANSDKIVMGDFNREESLKLGKEWFEKKDTLKFDDKGMLIINKPEPQ